MKLTQGRLQTFLIIVFTFVLLIFHAFPAFFLVKYHIFGGDSVWFACVTALSAFLALFVIPTLFITFVLKKPLYDFGVRFPESKSEALKLTGTILLLFLPVIIFFGTQTDFQRYYVIHEKLNILFIFSVISSGLYYFSEEFLFRGFLFFGLLSGLGEKLKIHAFWIVSLIFALFHIGKPIGEVFFAFSLGLSLCYLSFKTKSFIPAAVVHFVLAVVLNLTVFLS